MTSIIADHHFQLEVITVKKYVSWPRCESCNRNFNVGDKKLRWRTRIHGKYYAIWQYQCVNCASETFDAYRHVFNSDELADAIRALSRPIPRPQIERTEQ